ncbi:MAG: hypothetical protein RIS29_1425 [Bacteroidota bacterium]
MNRNITVIYQVDSKRKADGNRTKSEGLKKQNSGQKFESARCWLYGMHSWYANYSEGLFYILALVQLYCHIVIERFQHSYNSENIALVKEFFGVVDVNDVLTGKLHDLNAGQ